MILTFAVSPISRRATVVGLSFLLVTTGWLNRPLEMIKFWSWLESIVEKYTGAKPRSDDFAWAQKTEKLHYY